MTRTLPQLLGVLAIAVLVHCERIDARATQTTVNVATSANPVVIAVLSDHYTDEQEFNFDVQNLIVNGLLAHPFYAAHRTEFEVVSVYETLPAGSQSNYGFNVEVPSGYCALSWTISSDDSNTVTRIDEAVAAINPKHTIIIGDHPYNIGCTDGAWTYVARGIIGTDVLPHELGHGLANLYDEWFLTSNAGVSHPGIPLNQTRNCYDTRHGSTPPWMPPTAGATTYPGAGSYAGCDFFELDVVHPFPPHLNGRNYCLMGATHGAEFCPVCYDLMRRTFDPPNPDAENPDVGNPDVENPDVTNPTKVPRPPGNLRIVKIAYQQPAPGTVKPTAPGQPPAPSSTLKPAQPRPIVRLIAAFDPNSGRLRPKKGIAVTARYAPEQRRLGDYAYEMVVNGQRHVGVIPSNLFRSHSYQGGVAHGASAPHETDITLQIPDVTAEMVRTGKLTLTITIYRLGADVMQSTITPAILTDLRSSGRAEQRGVALTAKDLLSVMSTP